MNKKALLVVSFGTSYEATRKKTIDGIEQDLSSAFPDRIFYRAWTSKMIIRKIKNRDGIHVDTVTEAMERMIADGIDDVLVQPTHILNGVENDLMREDIAAFRDRFKQIRIGDPLLMYTDDFIAVARGVADALPSLKEDEAIVFMGHGTDHSANMTYPALDYVFRDLGLSRCFVATVEGYPALDSVMRDLKACGCIRKVYLVPFMIVAGDHALNDMAGEEHDSWKNQLETAGYCVECILRGLGEYEVVRKLLKYHALKASGDFFEI